MPFILSTVQFYAVVIAVFAIIGFVRGFDREMISTAFIVPTVLFLYVGGATGLVEGIAIAAMLGRLFF